MIKPKSIFEGAFLSCTSRFAPVLDDVLLGEYDLGVFGSSWDSRAISMERVQGVSVGRGIGVFYDLRDDAGLRDHHDPIVTAFVNRVSDRPYRVEGSSHEWSDLWEKLLAELYAEHSRVRRPLRMLINLATCPRILSLGLIATGLRSGLLSSVSAFYVEADYVRPESDPQIVFTGGRWSTVPIPGLEGWEDPAKRRRFYLVSVGWDSEQTLREVEAADVDRLSLLMAGNDEKMDYVREAEERNAELIRRYSIPKEQILRVNPYDAIEGWRELANARVDERDDESVYYLCCGTKPLSLSLALRALELDHPTVLYVVPERHTVIATKMRPRCWVFEICDRSSVR